MKAWENGRSGICDRRRLSRLVEMEAGRAVSSVARNAPSLGGAAEPSNLHTVSKSSLRTHCALLFSALLLLPAAGPAATFPGNAYISVADSTGSLSWNASNPNKALTIACWFKLSIPSDKLANPEGIKDMVIVMNRQDGDTGQPSAYLLRFSAERGNVEFVTTGNLGEDRRTVIQRPYLERWYHVAVKRKRTVLTFYVDGREVVPPESPAVVLDDSVANKAGLAIGGSSSGKYFDGDIQEVVIYQNEASPATIRGWMFNDLPADQLPDLKGYFKLAASTNITDRLKNFALNPPDDAKQAKDIPQDAVTFEELDKAGEQSVFDSRKNGGRDAIAPLSGSFSWQQTAFARPTPGVAFDFRFGYNSGNAFNSSKIGDYNPYEGPVLSPGWRHSFETIIVPQPTGNERQLVLWDGSIEVWTRTNSAAPFRPRHKEYRGELTNYVDNTGIEWVEWITPERLVYRYHNPSFSDEDPLDVKSMAGRLDQIRDFNSNLVQLLWNRPTGVLTQVVDSAGGRYDFTYQGNSLKKLSFGNWSVTFIYDANNRLTEKSLAGPPGYTQPNTTWRFAYSTKANGSNLLERITDPRGNTNTYVEYDKYGRKVLEKDGVDRTTQTQYGVPAKRQIKHIDPDLKEWTETYDRKHRLFVQRDPLTYETKYTYDEQGNRTSITDPLTNVTRFAYDERANVTNRVNAREEVTTWKFHSFFNKATEEVMPQPADANGWTTWTNHYVIEDGTGNLHRHYDALGDLVRYTYTTNGLVEISADANGNTTRFAYDTNGFLIARIDAAGFTTRYGYNEVGWKLAETNALGQGTTFAYDVNGNVVRRVDPLQRVFVSEYDPNGNLTKQFDAKGQTNRYDYDAANQRIKMTDRANSAWAYTYTKRGELEMTTDPLLKAVTNEYDPANRLIKTTFPEVNGVSAFVRYEYDANGNRTNTIDKFGQSWATRYDQLNRVTEEKNPFGDTKRTTYDVAGRIEKITTPRGFVTTHTYDGRGRLTLWKDAEDFEWRYTYDGVGNIIDIEDALQGHYVMAYGTRNERRSEKNQDNFEWRYEYDELLRLKKQTDPNGTTRTLAYDAGGRVESVTFNTGRVNAFAYDSNNNPEVLVRTGSGPPTISVLGYDVRDKVIEYADAFGKRINYDYDQLGRVKTQVYPDGKKLTYEYDPLSRLTNQVFQFDPQRAFRTTYAYDAADRLVGRTYPNGIVQSNAFDKAGRLTNLTYQATSTPNPPPSNLVAIALTYAYDANGNKTGSTEKGTLNWRPQPFTDEAADYTRSGRLKTRTITALAPSGPSAAVGSPSPLGGERAGGRGDSDSAPSAAVASPSPLGGERAGVRGDSNSAVRTPNSALPQTLLTPPAPVNWSYAYDPSGNLTNATSSAGIGYALTYDEDNRTTSIRYETAAGATNILNRYDAFGRRVARTMNGAETRYVLDLAGSMERILCDVDANNVITAYYVHGPDLAFKLDATGNLTCYHADAMANIVALSDGMTNLVAQYAYTPYGRLLGSTNLQSQISNPYLFVGSQGVMEELPGLYFMRARYYSAEAGVFLSTDPVKPIGPAWRPVAHAYAEGNPLSRTDPTGEKGQLLDVTDFFSLADVGYQTLADEISLKAGIEQATEIVGMAVFGAAIVAAAPEAAAALTIVGIGALAYDMVEKWEQRKGIPGALRKYGESRGASDLTWGRETYLKESTARNQSRSTKTVSPGQKWATPLTGMTTAPRAELQQRTPDAGRYAVAANTAQSTGASPTSNYSGSSSGGGGGGGGGGGFSKTVQSVANAVSNAANSVSSAVQNYANQAAQAVSNAVTTVAQTVSNAAQAVWGWITGGGKKK